MACSDWEPIQLLEEYLPLLPKGLVLDVAMGQGRNTLYLAQHDFIVEGVDANEDAIKICQEEVIKRGVTVKARHSDLTNYHLPPETYDITLCFYYLQRALTPQMKAGLKDGGFTLLYIC